MVEGAKKEVSFRTSKSHLLSENMASSKTVSLTLNVAQADLPALMALAAKSGVAISAAGGKGKALKKDPDAPKKEPNDWIVFTQRARKALEAGGLKPGFAVQQYCSSLKESLPLVSVTDDKGKEKKVPDYDSISDAELLSRFKSWTPPEQSKAEVERASKASSAEGSPAAGAPPAAAEKPKRQWSEAAKASAAEKRAATKAAKAGGAAPVVAKAAAPAAAAEEADVTEFAPVKIGGVTYLMNCERAVVTEQYEWVGRLGADGKTLDKKAAKPDYLDE